MTTKKVYKKEIKKAIGTNKECRRALEDFLKKSWAVIYNDLRFDRERVLGVNCQDIIAKHLKIELSELIEEIEINN